MKPRTQHICWLLIALPCVALSNVHENGAELASACTACHGTGGQSQGAVPSLAGMKAARFSERMQAFKAGDGTIMNRIAPGYDSREIDMLARYFAAQPTATSDEAGDK